jgi:hypothetical protein
MHTVTERASPRRWISVLGATCVVGCVVALYVIDTDQAPVRSTRAPIPAIVNAPAPIAQTQVVTQLPAVPEHNGELINNMDADQSPSLQELASDEDPGMRDEAEALLELLAEEPTS